MHTAVAWLAQPRTLYYAALALVTLLLWRAVGGPAFVRRRPRLFVVIALVGTMAGMTLHEAALSLLKTVEQRAIYGACLWTTWLYNLHKLVCDELAANPPGRYQ
jgi:hypothetical protein